MNLNRRKETVSRMWFNVQQLLLDEFRTSLKNKTNWFWFVERIIHWFFHFVLCQLLIDLTLVEVLRIYSNEKNQWKSRVMMAWCLLFKTSHSQIHLTSSRQNYYGLQTQKLFSCFLISKLLTTSEWFRHWCSYQPGSYVELNMISFCSVSNTPLMYIWVVFSVVLCWAKNSLWVIFLMEPFVLIDQRGKIIANIHREVVSILIVPTKHWYSSGYDKRMENNIYWIFDIYINTVTRMGKAWLLLIPTIAHL